jgi:hypothetical protein
MKDKVKITLLFIFSTLLASCATPEERAERARQWQYEAQLAQQAFVEKLNAKCIGYGFQPGTTAFAQCLQQAEQQAEQQESMNTALKMQQDELKRQKSERDWQTFQCYLKGRVDC